MLGEWLAGALSAWYVWAALGLFPQPGVASYLLGSPSFANVTLQLPSGPAVLLAHGASPAAVYVQRCELNGEPMDVRYGAVVPHAALTRPGGSRLECWMGTAPPF